MNKPNYIDHCKESFTNLKIYFQILTVNYLNLFDVFVYVLRTVTKMY